MKSLSMVALGMAAVGALVLLKRRTGMVAALDPGRFILEACVDQWTDIETARLALKTSDSAELQFFAQLIVDNNKALNNQLRTLASDRGMHMPSKAELGDILTETVAELRSADAFNTAYALQQPELHEQRIFLYQTATRLEDIDLANFARQALEKMQEHLKMSRALVTHLQLDDSRPEQASGHSPAPQNSNMTQVTGSDIHLSKGVPQQTRGEARNPGH